MKKTARLYYCALCRCQVIICSDCDRGNIYCNQGCAHQARQSSLRDAGKRYQQTYQGKLNHAHRQRRYRERLKQQTNKVTHQGSNEMKVAASLVCSSKSVKSMKIEMRDVCHCHFCGESIPEFLRTDYLQHGMHQHHSMFAAPKRIH